MKDAGVEEEIIGGGRTVAHTFMSEGLVDQIVIDLHPVAFGEGRQLILQSALHGHKFHSAIPGLKPALLLSPVQSRRVSAKKREQKEDKRLMHVDFLNELLAYICPAALGIASLNMVLQLLVSLFSNECRDDHAAII